MKNISQDSWCLNRVQTSHFHKCKLELLLLEPSSLFGLYAHKHVMRPVSSTTGARGVCVRMCERERERERDWDGG
jgi:hypothetical protein